MKRMLLGVLFTALGMMFTGCGDSSSSNAKSVTSFSFENPAAQGTISETSHTIAVTVPFGTEVTALVPTIIQTGTIIAPASGVARDFTNPVVYTVTAADASTQDYTVTVTVVPSTAKAITAFSFANYNAVGTISETSHTIAVTVPFGTNITTLVPTIIHTGASIRPATGVAQDFTDAVIYTVTAANASTQDYTVTVTVAPSTAKAITAFSFANYNAVGTISETSHTIAVTVPFGTVVTALVPTIVHTGTIIAPASGVAQDFTNPVVYTVTAADASTQDYTVTVTVTPSSSKEITAFNFAAPAAEGTISEASHTIDATLPSGTVVTALVPTIVHTGTSISPASEVAQDFTNPVVYTVTAADASTQDYTVTVTVTPWEVCGDVLTYAGENYPTVQIGTQCWIARNLDVGTATPSANGQGTSCASIKKFCYEDSGSNCEAYGGLYTWTQAMCGAQTEKSQGICPSGWHIPSDPEYVTLANALGPGGCSPYPGGNYPGTFCGAPAGDRLKSAGLCQGRTPCGDSGFEGLLGGGFSPSGDNVVFYSVEVQASFWTSSLNGNNVEAWRRGLDVNYSGVDGSYFWTSITTGRSVRCVKDE